MPGWGVQLPVERVLSEMVEVGFRATELGSVGYLPSEVDELKACLDRHDLILTGGFNALTLADPARSDIVVSQARTAAALLSAAGATDFITCVVSSDEVWERPGVSCAQWEHVWDMLVRLDEICGEFGLVQSFHSHVDSLVETADEIRRVLDHSSVRWVLDTAHLRIGGFDPVRFADDHGDRVHLVHLKDLDVCMAARLNSGAVDFPAAVQAGMFVPLGEGDIDIAAVINRMEYIGFDGWYVIEQDAAITGAEPPPGDGPIRDVQRSVAFLRSINADGVEVRSPELCTIGSSTPN